ncbi:MAG: N-acetylmuramoyl-L-alanine amidase [Bdellovibrionales bacterium]
MLFAIESGAAPLKVILDPGHGGKDEGAHAADSKESHITLSVTEMLYERLKEDGRFVAYMTRRNDEFLDLGERVRRAEQAKGDLLLSIHANWSTDPKARGVEIYFQNQLPPDEESMYLAARENEGHARGLLEAETAVPSEVQLIIRDLARNQRVYASSRLAKSLELAWRGGHKAKSKSIRQAPFFVISNLTIPSALIEIGYLSHPEERLRLVTAEYQQLVAQSLHEGLIRYHESLDKPQAPRLQ